MENANDGKCEESDTEQEIPLPLSKSKQKMMDREKKRLLTEMRNKTNTANNGMRVEAKGDPEIIRLPTQQWYVISFVSPLGLGQRSSHVMIKFRGAFETSEEADKHAQKVHKVDPDFDIHIFKANEWIQVPPPEKHYDSVPMKYMQDELRPIMDSYYDEQKKKKLNLDKRIEGAKKKSKKLLKKTNKHKPKI